MGTRARGNDVFRFQKLDVWQKAIHLTNRVNEITKDFPNDERFGLTSQMKRSAVSIAAIVAEGSGRVSGEAFASFLEISYGSLMETLPHAMIAEQQGFLSENTLSERMKSGEELSLMLSGFRSKLKSP